MCLAMPMFNVEFKRERNEEIEKITRDDANIYY